MAKNSTSYECNSKSCGIWLIIFKVMHIKYSNAHSLNIQIHTFCQKKKKKCSSNTSNLQVTCFKHILLIESPEFRIWLLAMMSITAVLPKWSFRGFTIALKCNCHSKNSAAFVTSETPLKCPQIHSTLVKCHCQTRLFLQQWISLTVSRW